VDLPATALGIAPRDFERERGERRAAIAPIGRSPALLAVIGGAWLIVLVAHATGNAAALHHHALIEGGPPLWVAVPVFLTAWLVMVAAMMLPANLPAVRVFRARSLAPRRPAVATAAFLGAYAIVWAGFGFLAFMSDFALHHLVDATPWLAERPWLIEAAVLALAGGYQFLPLKRRALEVCRHPGDLSSASSRPGEGAAGLGFRHGFDCLRSSWALMLVMFAAGFASLSSMAALTALMVDESTGRHGQRAATAAGIVLILAAVATLAGA
jgi:predicted metal-binding membrane protein